MPGSKRILHRVHFKNGKKLISCKLSLQILTSGNKIEIGEISKENNGNYQPCGSIYNPDFEVLNVISGPQHHLALIGQKSVRYIVYSF
jgi:hypothetical protein